MIDDDRMPAPIDRPWKLQKRMISWPGCEEITGVVDKSRLLGSTKPQRETDLG